MDHRAGDDQNLVEFDLIVPPIAFGGIVGMKAPATGTRTASVKIGTALRYGINWTLDKTGSTSHN